MRSLRDRRFEIVTGEKNATVVRERPGIWIARLYRGDPLTIAFYSTRGMMERFMKRDRLDLQVTTRVFLS